MKILLDTDIGSDIDDAVALAYLLAQPECELLGITTVSGQPALRASIASALCKAAGKMVPIFPGAEAPLSGGQRQPEVPQAAALARWPHETSFLRGEAIPFMRRIIRENPGEVTLLTIGPLTNAALLFAADEEIPSLLKGLVIMGGAFLPRTGVNRAEWNIQCDPTAASIVYRHSVRQHRSVGLDVTTQVKMPADEVRRRFTAPLLKPVADFADIWFRNGHALVYHDPLAAATLFDSSLCGWAKGEITIEQASTRLAGLTFWKPDVKGPHEMAETVQPDRFFVHYFDVINRFTASTR